MACGGLPWHLLGPAGALSLLEELGLCSESPSPGLGRVSLCWGSGSERSPPAPQWVSFLPVFLPACASAA